MSLITTIQSDEMHLSKSFRRIANLILKEPQLFMSKTVRELSRIAGVSEPTLIRFCRHYKYSGVPEFRIALALSQAAHRPIDANSYFEPSVEDKTIVNRTAKRSIATYAADLVEENQSIILDSGSTTWFMAEALCNYPPLTILTTGLNIAQVLRSSHQHTIILPGGTLRPESMSLGGRMVETSLSTMHFDIAFIGSDSIDPKIGLSTFNENEGHQTLAMIRASKKIVVLADSSKFNTAALHKICSLDQVATLISDNNLPLTTQHAIRDAGVELICVPFLPQGKTL